MRNIFTLFFFAVFLISTNAQAADSRALKPINNPQTEHRIALVIGNGAYTNSPLKNPLNDAKDVAAKLRTMGFEVIERNNLQTKQIGGTLREFRSKLSPGAVALVFYAGHGLQIKGINYLPTVDADINSEEDAPNQSLSMNQIMDVLEESKSRLNLVFLDACRNNPYARSFRSGDKGLARVTAPSGTLISYSTRPGSVAADGSGRNGLYTSKLLAQMESNQQIELLLKRVVTEVKAASQGKQEPWMEGSIEGDFCFVGCGSGASTVANIAPAVAAQPKKETQTENTFSDCADCPEMVIIPDGSFTMGSNSGDDNEKPVRQILISKKFSLSKTEITRRQFAVFVNETGYSTGEKCNVIVDGKWELRNGVNWKNLGYLQDDNHPVACINWNDAQAFTEWLSSKTGKQYRLPSEAEWEYACGAGEQSKYCGSDDVASVAWNNVAKTYPVATKLPNAFGLYDMSGNVCEFVEDGFHPNYEGAPTNDGSAWIGDGLSQVVRGGSWINNSNFVRSTIRSWSAPNFRTNIFGFRVANTL
ncbi:MAG: SUMF1/EgtB/PvdO family nonheme iron enzyme [Gallionellaceae bacterium]|nr:SUMF1/EgtB/PvdO family nonheme iron enzyme [Gallionellaceae bacterium]